MDTKEFNLEHAKAGAPVKTVSGHNVEILKWDAKGGDTPIIGWVRQDEHSESLCRWSVEGISAATHRHEWRLVMAPLGYCEAKPVFYGDILQTRDGQAVEFSYWLPTETFDWSPYTWPKPAPAVETRMTDEDIRAAQFNGAVSVPAREGLRNIANAAIARAIADGDVVFREKVDELLEKVATTVRDRLAQYIGAYSGGAERYCLEKIDLPAIIKSVREAA